MTWFTELSLAFLLALCIHGKFAVGHPTPLESLDTVGAFINNFTSSAGQTIEDIIKTSVYTMREAGKTSSSTLQALNMAFASSLAEIAVSELGGANIPSRK
ncbi:uncharacterized protein [Parasteatoda tepidariorum]|uniref:uncharacterized protein n=1 Tax=Parasteatoda tepidariorum TaxID=114398 RepID=UPI00077FD352